MVNFHRKVVTLFAEKWKSVYWEFVAPLEIEPVSPCHLKQPKRDKDKHWGPTSHHWNLTVNRQKAKNLTHQHSESLVFSGIFRQFFSSSASKQIFSGGRKIPTKRFTTAYSQSMAESEHPTVHFAKTGPIKGSKSRRGDITQSNLILPLEALPLSQWLKIMSYKCNSWLKVLVSYFLTTRSNSTPLRLYFEFP